MNVSKQMALTSAKAAIARSEGTVAYIWFTGLRDGWLWDWADSEYIGKDVRNQVIPNVKLYRVT